MAVESREQGPAAEYQQIEALRERHPAWRMLRATHAPLLLTVLDRFFVEEGRGGSPDNELVAALDDQLYAMDARDPANPRFLRTAAEYLADWAAPESGFLRRCCPLGADEIHDDATLALEKASTIASRPSLTVYTVIVGEESPSARATRVSMLVSAETESNLIAKPAPKPAHASGAAWRSAQSGGPSAGR